MWFNGIGDLIIRYAAQHIFSIHIITGKPSFFFYRLKILFWLSSTLLTTSELIYHLLPFPLPSENSNKMTDEVSQCTKAKYAT